MAFICMLLLKLLCLVIIYSFKIKLQHLHVNNSHIMYCILAAVRGSRQHSFSGLSNKSIISVES